jgi:DNA polymerase-1
MAKNRLVLIDGHALLFRAYYAYPPLTTQSGELVNAVYGFTSILLNTIRELEPTHLAVSFDLGEPTFRHKAFKAYKAQRAETPQDLIDQEGRLKQVVKTLNIPIYEKAGFEADDVIGTMAEQAKSKEILVIIVTGDMDALQLVDDDPKGKVHVFVPARGKNSAIMYDEIKVQNKFDGLEPEQVIDLKGLAGDSSDNIPGVKGIGPKTAITLLKKFKTVKQVYQALDNGKIKGVVSDTMIERLKNGRDSAFESKMLATIVRDAPVKLNLKDCAIHQYDKAKVLKLFNKLNFKSLISKLPNDEFETDVQEALF